jgi:chitinase
LPLAAYVWNFGDGGSPVTLLSPTTQKTFNVDSGNFVVSLTVIDNDGDESDPFSLQVQLRPNRPPIARFTASVETSGSARIATFDASQSSDPDSSESQPFLTYKWDFGKGDPITTTLSSIIQERYGPGDYVVTLVVFDGLDDSTAAFQGLQVR